MRESLREIFRRALRERACVVMVGTFPPPVDGMAVVNMAVRRQLERNGVRPLLIDLSVRNRGVLVPTRLTKALKGFAGMAWLLMKPGLSKSSLYMSASGGWGQLIELFLVLAARARRMRVFLHHHSYSYLECRRSLTALLVRLAGKRAIHITQSKNMSRRLEEVYHVAYVESVSNAVFHSSGSVAPARQVTALRTVGFISNLAVEKGVLDFLRLSAAMQDRGLYVNAVLAGPFQNREIKRVVEAYVASLSNLEYVGPVYGHEKEKFFQMIDLLIFPTRYKNETEGIVNHEAMSRGLPVIAYGRGCISEIVDTSCGKVIPVESEFVPAALAQIQEWIWEPSGFAAASRAAACRFSQTYTASAARWAGILERLLESQTRYT